MMTINEERCKSCGLCMRACRLGLLKVDENKINSNGYHPVYLTDQEKCVACCACALTCPDMCIDISAD